MVAYDKHDDRIDPISSAMSSQASPDVGVSKCHEFTDGGNDNGFCQSNINKRAPDWDPWLVFEYPANAQIRRITVINRPCCTGRIAGASISISSDRDAKHVLWSGKFEGIRKLYTWRLEPILITTARTAFAITTVNTTVTTKATIGMSVVCFYVFHRSANPHSHMYT